MNNRSLSSLMSRVVGFILLLFAIFFAAINLFQSPTHLRQICFLLFLVVLFGVIYFTYDISRTIKLATDTIDKIAHGDFSTQPIVSNTQEIYDFHEKVNQLSQRIQLSQENLENQHHQLDSILTYMTDGVIATNRSGHVILANTSALHLLSTTKAKILKQTIAEALKIDSYFAFRDLLQKTPNISIDSENSYGEYVRIQIIFSIFRRETGEISGIIAVLHDVTESEKLEREQRLFVSNVSHELRTPLTTIKSYLETLNDGALSEPEIAADFVSTSLNETNHMIQIVSDILDLSRMDMGHIPLQKEMVNVADFLSHLVDRFNQVAENDASSKTIFETDFPDSHIWTEFDISKMSQVIDNILSNAVKYSPHGGKITLQLIVNSSQLLIRISDRGVGIPAKDLPKIFDRFYRVDKARNHDAGGTGLGLAIAYDIVKLHQGNITVKSKIGKGTEFTITLPYSPVSYDFDLDDHFDKQMSLETDTSKEKNEEMD